MKKDQEYTFDASMGTIQRINYHFMMASIASVNNDIHSWKNHLMQIHRDIYSLAKQEDKDELQLTRYKITRIPLNNQSSNNQMMYYDMVDEYERKIKDVATKLGIYMKESQSPSEALL